MTEKDILDENNLDEGSSLEKQIEKLEKNDPAYTSKREKLIARLQIFKSELEKIHQELKQQYRELHASLNLLHKGVENAPQNEEMRNLEEKAALDKAFLIRAVAEVISLKGNLQKEFKLLKSSDDFKQPVDTKIITNIKVKPLPSSKMAERKRQTQNAVYSVKTKKAKHLPLGHKILQLRLSSPERTMPRRTKERINTRN